MFFKKLWDHLNIGSKKYNSPAIKEKNKKNVKQKNFNNTKSEVFSNKIEKNNIDENNNGTINHFHTNIDATVNIHIKDGKEPTKLIKNISKNNNFKLKRSQNEKLK